MGKEAVMTVPYKRYEFPELGFDIEVEPLCSMLKFFVHKEPDYFGQCVLNTGEIGDSIVKGLETSRMPDCDRRKLNKAIKRVAKELTYIQGIFQRVKPDGTIISNKVDLTKIP